VVICLIGSAVFAQFMAERPYTLRWAALFHFKTAHSHGDLSPLSNTIPWTRLSPQPKQHLDWFSHFRQSSLQFPYTLLWASPSPVKIAPFHLGIWTPI